MTSLTFTLPTFNDTLFEGAEAFSVSINTPSQGSVVAPTANATIIDNDAANIAWSIAGGGNVTEGGAPSFTASYTGATLAEGNTVSITLAFGAGATEAADFPDSFLQDIDDAIAAVPGSGITRSGSVLTFSNPAVTSLTFTLPTFNDTLFEGAEAFSVSINTPSQGSVVAPTANATIIDNDAANIAWSIAGGGNVTEGGAPSFTVSYTGATLAEGNTVSITLAFGAGATEAADFPDSFLQDIDDAIAAVPGSGITRSGSVLTFSNPAVTSLTFTLPTFNDTLFEGAEAFSVSINTPSQGSVVAPTANATIIDNDAANIAWSIAGGGNVTEGGAPSFTVSYTGATLAEGNTVSITLAFGAGATEAADFPDSFLQDIDDAIAAVPGSGITRSGSVLTFSNPAVTSLTFTLPTFNDTLFEGAEAFSVSINTPSQGSVVAPTANATIIDNDAANIAWSIAGGGNVTEGGAPSFTVSYTGATLAEGNTVSITLAFGAGATEAADFPDSFLQDIDDAIAAVPGSGITRSGSVLTFSNPAVTSLTFTLPTFNDTLFEGAEAFSVSINTPSQGSVVAPTANATIIDNDAANIAWSIAGGGNVTEGGAPSFTVSYTGATLAEGNTVSITLAFGAGATEAADFPDSFLQDIDDAIAAVPGSGITRSGSVLTFSNPAVTSLTFTLPTFNDTLFEGAEAFSVSINTPSQGSVVAPTANATIIDNDPLAGAPITLEVDEAAMSTAGATGSNPSLTTEVDNSPTLSFTAAGFNLVSFAFSNDISGLITDLNGDASQDIFWVRDSGTQISGYLDSAHTLLADRLTLSGLGTIAAGTTGSVTVTETLSDNLKHLTANGAQVSSLGDVGVVATDTNGNTATGTVHLTVKDDTPKADLVAQSVVATAAKTNVMIILDLSGSMVTTAPGLGISRLDVAKAAINELLEQYDNRGDVMVRLVTFATNGAEVGNVWMTVDQAKAAVAGLSATGNTNYDAALLAAMGAFTDGTKLSGPGTQNVSYFISDGDPTANSDWPQISGTQNTDGIQANEQTVWRNFLANPDGNAGTNDAIISYALGIPDVATPTNLNPIAFDPAAGTQLADTPIIVTDLAQLTSTLVFSMPPVNGGFVAGVNGGTVGSFGADGGFLHSITVDGVTYIFNPTTNTVTNISSIATYVQGTHTLTIDTDPSATGGQLAVVMTTGAFTFQPTSGFTSEPVSYVLADSDGDTASNTVTFSAGVGAAAGSLSASGGEVSLLETVPPLNASAAIAGELINLALTDPSADQVGAVTLTITGVPADGTLSEGTGNGDGSGTAQTDNTAALSIMSPDNNSGATVLDVMDTGIGVDTGIAIVADNVDAKGSPIFASSADDTLTASSGSDPIVFAQPIGNDTINDFDVTADKIDLVGFDSISGFDDAQSGLTSNSNGETVVTIGNEIDPAAGRGYGVADR